MFNDLVPKFRGDKSQSQLVVLSLTRIVAVPARLHLPAEQRAPPRLSITQPCRLLELLRSTYYHAGVGESDEHLQLVRRIDEQYLLKPFYGSRGMTQWLIRQRHSVNQKRIQRLIGVMGLEAS